MDRAEKAGLGISVAGHALLFALLSLGLLAVAEPVRIVQQPIDVTLVKDVGLAAAAPRAVTSPAQSVAPEQGAPEDAAPPPPIDAPPEPQPIPDSPAPKPAPLPPEAASHAKPAPAAKRERVTKPTLPTSAPVRAVPAKPVPAPKPVAVVAPARTKPRANRGTGSDAAGKTVRPHGSRLGADFLKGLTDKPTKSVSKAPAAAKVDARAMASIVQAIARQIQPCADRQVNPGPGANEIVITLNLRLNEDGTLAATPRVVGTAGDGDENGRYVQRVTDLGIAAFKGCSPLKLPSEYYSTPNGGWNNINYKWQLR